MMMVSEPSAMPLLSAVCSLPCAVLVKSTKAPPSALCGQMLVLNDIVSELAR